ncbi:MAG TPA: hypothetical protein GX513_12410 [Firmicutes bacterium]|nr:hypothetical protein [Bacillota bacterium]
MLADLEASRRRIFEHLGYLPTALAYPYAACTAQTAQLARRHFLLREPLPRRLLLLPPRDVSVPPELAAVLRQAACVMRKRVTMGVVR